jgi:hypothetical protein
MKRLQYVPLLFLIFLSLGVASVFGNGYTVGVPILGTTGSPALASPSVYSGVITVLYADGTTVVLSANHVNLELCSTTCVTVATTLKQTSPGTYSYTFTPPSLSGTITIYVQAGNLADDNGRIFPSVNTQIGTYVSPTTGSLSATGTSHPSLPATAPNQVKPANEIDQAVQAAHTTQASPILGIVAVLSALVVAACSVLRPWRP